MKTAINKKLTIAIFAFVGVLVGCNSEVDKCTDAYMKANTLKERAPDNGAILPPGVVDPTLTYEDKLRRDRKEAEREANFRLSCLRASKGG